MKGKSREFVVAYTAAFRLILKLDEVVPSEDLKIWLGAMQLNTEFEPFDSAMESYFEDALSFAELYYDKHQERLKPEAKR